jgi:hypothetical protein
MVELSCNPSYAGGRGRRIAVNGWLWGESQEGERHYLKNK